MPQVTAQGKTFTCHSGSNLRQVLLDHDIALHNGPSKVVNCRGIGTCGTCAVAIEGAVSEPNWQEKTRLTLPPHSPASNRRLACQIKVLGDICVTKYDGFWGQSHEVIWSPAVDKDQSTLNH
ncbi:MAG: 2Fe-2S iron-sulfur cluster-binding protein [Cyanophyceae cyanobacterium]